MINKKVEGEEIWFFGSQFEQPKTGGELYNAEVLKVLKEYNDSLKVKAYPWSSEFTNLLFDIKHCFKTLFSIRKKTIVINESQHQRLALTILGTLLSPRCKLVVMFHQLAYLRRRNKFHRWVTKQIDRFLIARSYRSISAGLYLTDQMKILVSPKYYSKIRPVLTTCQTIMPFSINKKPNQFLFVGTITKAKGILEMIHAVNRLPENIKNNLDIKLAGSLGDEVFIRQCKTLIDEFNLTNQFDFVGMKNVDELKTLYSESAIYLFPTHAEGMPMSLMEAMTAGCIPIVFNNTALPYMVKDNESGFICDNLNVEQYAKNIERAYQLSATEANLMREKCRDKSLEYARSWRQVGEEFRDALQEA